MDPAPIATPCVRICVLDDEGRLCLGCGRTLDEIARWSSYTPEAREAIMAEAPGRLGARAVARRG